MAKKRVKCPKCGHAHTIEYGHKMQRIGVRSRRLTANQFEYLLTAPIEMIEDGEFTTIWNDLVLSGALGVAFGACGGYVAALLAPDFAIEIVSGSSLIGWTVAWGWLCAEHNQRLKRIPHWLIEQRANWASIEDETISSNVELTMDHRHRDGSTEIGRTIQYFGTLPVDVPRFNEWAIAVLGTDTIPGQSLAIANWTGSKGLFSRKEYDSLLAVLRKSQAVVLRGGGGHILTGGGQRALRQHLKAHPPTPSGERA
jgi:hypothetical protein